VVHRRADARETGSDFLGMASTQTALWTFPVLLILPRPRREGKWLADLFGCG